MAELGGRGCHSKPVLLRKRSTCKIRADSGAQRVLGSKAMCQTWKMPPFHYSDNSECVTLSDN
jgi:hypothetical protein